MESRLRMRALAAWAATIVLLLVPCRTLVAQHAASGAARISPVRALPDGPASSMNTRVQMGMLVRPDSVNVGDIFTLTVTMSVPVNARVEWPSIADSSAAVAMRGLVRVTVMETDSIARRERAEYTLSAWDTGPLPIGLADAVVRYDDATVRVPLAGTTVFVKSVLPADTSLHEPKPARGLFLRSLPWWQRWWPAGLVLAALWLLWRFRKGRSKEDMQAVLTAVDPYTSAVKGFDRLELMALVDAGECSRHVALSIDVLRHYVAALIGCETLSLTSVELTTSTANDRRIPHDRLISLLTDADGVKFAARPVSAPRAHEMFSEARAIVDWMEREDRERRAALEALRNEAEIREARELQEVEERARRTSRRPRVGAR